jgi:Adenylate and Guanylate cyclase catalytic domain
VESLPGQARPSAQLKFKGMFHMFKGVNAAAAAFKQVDSGGKAFKSADGTCADVTRSPTSGNHRLSLKVICGAGSVCVYHCGGKVSDTHGSELQLDDKVARWEFFLGDSAFAPDMDDAGNRQTIAQISGIEEHASPGDVIISHEMLKSIGLNNVEADVLLGGAVRLRAMQLNSQQSETLTGNPINPPAGPQQLPSHVAARAAALFRMHVVDNIRQRIEAGQYDFINEIRQLTILFMGFPSLKEADSNLAHQLGPVQDTVMAVNRIMNELQGSFVQFRCDEKGFLAICAFGLPGSSHANNPERAILAALRMQEVIEAFGHRFACGITTGNLLCACVGSKLRSEYTMFGDAINMSARLMCKAKAGLGTLLSDEPTFQKAAGWASFSALQPLQLKGKAQPVKVRPLQ